MTPPTAARRVRSSKSSYPTPPRSPSSESDHEDNKSAPRKGAGKHIPRPPNAFVLFRQTFCADLKTCADRGDRSKGPDGSAISKRAGELWNALSSAEKRPFQEEARQRKDALLIKHPDYKYTPSRKYASAKAANSKRVTKRPVTKPAPVAIVKEEVETEVADDGLMLSHDGHQLVTPADSLQLTLDEDRPIWGELSPEFTFPDYSISPEWPSDSTLFMPPFPSPGHILDVNAVGIASADTAYPMLRPSPLALTGALPEVCPRRDSRSASHSSVYLISQPLTFNDPLDNLHPPTYSLFLPIEEHGMGSIDHYFDFTAYYHDDDPQ